MLQNRQYNAKSPEEKYAHVAEYQDFKRGVWDINHKNIPQPESWFTTATANENDDIVVGQEIQSLNCPITLTLLEKPVRNTKCVHVYSLEAIRELVRQGGGKCKCPVSGCVEEVVMERVREDKVMERKVREERRRREERSTEGWGDALEVNEGISEIDFEDEDVKFKG